MGTLPLPASSLRNTLATQYGQVCVNGLQKCRTSVLAQQLLVLYTQDLPRETGAEEGGVHTLQYKCTVPPPHAHRVYCLPMKGGAWDGTPPPPGCRFAWQEMLTQFIFKKVYNFFLMIFRQGFLSRRQSITHLVAVSHEKREGLAIQ